MVDRVNALIERLFWWLVGIFGSLILTATGALISVLWHMNGSIVTLNERVGTVVNQTVKQEERSQRFEMALANFKDDLRSLAEAVRFNSEKIARLETTHRKK